MIEINTMTAGLWILLGASLALPFLASAYVILEIRRRNARDARRAYRIRRNAKR